MGVGSYDVCVCGHLRTRHSGSSKGCLFTFNRKLGERCFDFCPCVRFVKSNL